MEEYSLIKFQKKLVSRIRELREEKEMSQLELAKLVGVSRQAIYYLEKGKSNPSLARSLKISEIFKKSIEEIFYFEPIIKDLMGGKTLDDLDKIAKKTGIKTEILVNIRCLDDEKLSETFSEADLLLISEAFNMEFEDLFIIEGNNEN